MKRKGQGNRRAPRRKQEVDFSRWKPRTRLGAMVASGELKSIDDVLSSGLPLREPEVVSMLMPELADEVLEVNMVQRMTDSGRRVKFRVTAVVGNSDGYVGMGGGKDVQVGPAIKKGIENAKLNLIKVERGCGSWECACGTPHSVPFEVVGECGSVTVKLLPAPQGLGIAAAATARKVLEMAGIKDVWIRSSGQTRTTINFANATFDALRKVGTMKRPDAIHASAMEVGE
ncbi:MAG: 30S ribosomal protein S5 [Methermicoccaceae archaeon]